MKTFVAILTFFLTLICNAFSQQREIHVKVDILPELKNIINAKNIELIVVTDSIHKTIYLKSDTVSFSVPEFNCLYLSLQSYIDIDSFYKKYSSFYEIEKIKSGISKKIILQFPTNCQFNIQGLDRTCPKCNKKDNVIPICYGLPMFDENGNIAGPRCYPGGCFMNDCTPSWYCERDKHQF